MFEVDGTYENRIGKYRVLEMGPVKMKVRYEDGTEADLNIGIQERIWQNILADQEAPTTKKRKKPSLITSNKFYLKSIKSISDEELNPLAIRERVTPTGSDAPEISKGDRFVYYAADSQHFFAVATITGDPKKADANDYVDMDFPAGKINIFPIDLDAFATQFSPSISADAVELESQPNFKSLLTSGEIYLDINEDDFELLAELLTEISEDADELEDEDDEDEEDDEEVEDDLEDDELGIDV